MGASRQAYKYYVSANSQFYCNLGLYQLEIAQEHHGESNHRNALSGANP